MVRTASRCVGGLDGTSGAPAPRGSRSPSARRRRAAAASGATRPVARSRRRWAGGAWESFDGRGVRGGQHHLSDGEQRDITRRGTRCGPTLPAARAAGWWPTRPVGFQRVDDGGGVAARIVAGQSPRVEHPGGQERGRQDLHVAGQCRDLPTARRRFCSAVSPRPPGADGSTDGITSRPSRRNTSRPGRPVPPDRAASSAVTSSSRRAALSPAHRPA